MLITLTGFIPRLVECTNLIWRPIASRQIIKTMDIENCSTTRMLRSGRSVPVNFRLITATNKDPAALVRQGLFREDLLFRINTIQIEIPLLRERKEDICGLADFYLAHYTEKYEKPAVKFAKSAYDSMVSYHWPGNIRELKHSIEKAVILSDHSVIKPVDLDLKPRIAEAFAECDERLADVERNAIVKVLDRCRGNITQAAKILDISRTTLYAKIKEYRI